MVRHFSILIPNGGVVALKDVIPAVDLTLSFGALYFQALKAGAADIFVGATKDTSAAAPISSTNYGFRVDPADTAPPIEILRGSGAALRLGDFSVAGTAGDTLTIFGVED
jgi:hypothetical protein